MKGYLLFVTITVVTITVLLMALSPAAIPSAKGRKDATLASGMPISCNTYIVELDGHEYYLLQRGASGIALAHKADCKACESARKKEGEK